MNFSLIFADNSFKYILRSDNMKKITAYFNDSAKARSAAFDLSESGGCSGDILVGSVTSENAQLSNYVFTGLFCGAALGIVLGAAAALIPGIGIYAKTGIVTGLIAGAVIGAVSGALLDILNMDSTPNYSLVTICVPNKNGGRVSRNLKKRGAAYVVIEKDVSQDEKHR